jgi:hypothetical protein
MGASVWNKLFNAKLVRNIRFDEHLYIGEDMEYLCKCIVVANKVSYVNRCLYHYIYRKNSAMNDVFGEKKLTILTANQQVFKIIAGKYPELTGEMQFRESICCFSYLTHALKYGYTNRDTITELLSGMKKKKGMLLHKYHGVRKCLLLWCLMGTPYCVLLGKIMMFRNKIAGLWEAERKIH